MLKESYIAAYRKDQIDEEKLRELLTSLGLRTDYIETTIKAESYRKKVQRVEVETITDKIARLDYQEKQQLLYIQDLTTDLQAKERIYKATQDLWKERIGRLQEQISLTVDPTKRAKLEAQLRQMQIQADLAITRAEAAYIDAKEKIESAQAKLDEIRREKEVLRRAMGVT
jgi:chromosome segregation ATPase